MPSTQRISKERFTIWEAVKDFGWLPMILLSVGGLSIIDILERTVVQDLDLVTPFEVVLEGYRRITLLIGALVEPLTAHAIDWMNLHFDWDVRLQPHWRPLFVLSMVFVMSLARGSWKGGSYIDAIWSGVAMTLGVLTGALVIGLLPLRGDWWLQGLTAAIPTAGAWIALGAGAWLADLANGDLRWRPLIGGFQAGAIGGLFSFLLGAGFTFVPIFAAGAGIIALGVVIALVGAFLLLAGMADDDRGASFLGLSMLGGFVAAGLILVANVVINSLN